MPATKSKLIAISLVAAKDKLFPPGKEITVELTKEERDRLIKSGRAKEE